jgi:RNA polymerase sigma-70 factor (ECF subfamily)
MSDLAEPTIREWIREYAPQLLAVAQSFATEAQEAEDLVQETWVIAFQKFNRRPPDGAILSWLHSITLNLGKGLAKRRKRRSLLRRQWATEMPKLATEVNDPSISRHLANRRLWNCIAELPELQRQCVLLRVVEGMTTAEAAQAMGRAEGTVKASLHRGLEKLRNELEKHPSAEHLQVG